MEKLSLQEIISAVHGSYGYPADVEISDISTDTRTIKPGSLFIALKGENFDGHNFAAKAMELGAEAVVTERPVEGARCDSPCCGAEIQDTENSGQPQQ